MGHAGAVISGGSGTAIAKVEAMREAGITVVEGPHLLGRAMLDMLARRRARPAKAGAGKVPAAKRGSLRAVKAPPKGGSAGKAPARAAASSRRGGKVKKAAKGRR
jgi:succinyl-CoA synthetase alpha subunit